MFELFYQLIDLLRVPGIRVKERTGGNVQILTDVKEGSHGWEGLSAFNIIDIPCVLSQGQAHITGRYALFGS